MIEDDFENPFSEPFEIEIIDTLDLHSFSPKEVKSLVENYLVEAKTEAFELSGLFTAKALVFKREIVRKVLSETDFVRSYKNAPEFSGSWGSTIAELDV